MKQPFKRDEAKERLLIWKATRPDLWQNVSAHMNEDVDRYDQAKQGAEQAAALRAGGLGSCADDAGRLGSL